MCIVVSMRENMRIQPIGSRVNVYVMLRLYVSLRQVSLRKNYVYLSESLLHIMRSLSAACVSVVYLSLSAAQHTNA